MTFYFYDLETSGTDPKEQMIMQFAGQRTNQHLEPIGDIDDILIKLNPDVLPEPWAILTHGITPQRSITDGITEQQFAAWFCDNVLQPGTTVTGYNSVRFDDEFLRYTLFRNFYDPYRWHWDQDRSRWDLMDVARMTRALRPDGIVWPFTSEGVPNVKLEHLALVNGLTQDKAHTADSDVTATIELAQLMRSKQPKLFDYLFSLRHKDKVKQVVSSAQPFVYTSGSLASEFEKTSVMIDLGELASRPGTSYVYDLRYDPDAIKSMDPVELASHIYVKKDSGITPLPAKSITLNKCPAVAPLGVLDAQSWERIGLSLELVEANLKKLVAANLGPKIISAFELKNKQTQSSLLGGQGMAEGALYDGFIPKSDNQVMADIQSADVSELDGLFAKLQDQRLLEIAPRYKARNFAKSLTPEESVAWEKYVKQKFYSESNPRLQNFAKNLTSASQTVGSDNEKMYLLSELQLYVEGLIPSEY